MKNKGKYFGSTWKRPRALDAFFHPQKEKTRPMKRYNIEKNVGTNRSISQRERERDIRHTT
jgi:hypothetical protein